MAGDSSTILDTLNRPLRHLRISVTDRCNLRCRYCMPEDEYVWLERRDLLTFEELAALVGIFSELGVEKVHLTGGEPLLRRDFPKLVAQLRRNPRIGELVLTTNGVLLADHAAALKQAGLDRITVSLDTLRPERFRALTRIDGHDRVLAGIDAARRAGFTALKIDTVIVRGVNDDELADLIEFGKRIDAEVRFIEYMDVGGATDWAWEKVFSLGEMLERLSRRYGPIAPLAQAGAAPAARFALPDGTRFGIIASMTAPFCRACDRSRLTADGLWLLCLYAQRAADLRTPLREAAPHEEIKRLIVAGWRARADRGAEVRRDLRCRGPLVTLEQLRSDPHLEMHTRGG
jgi:cyclic pyranopterin phosphate synthase